MSETSGNWPEEMRRSLIDRSVEDDEFRERLLANPRAVIEEEMGAKPPGELDIRVVEETPDSIYLVLPPRASATIGESRELSDRDLEAVAGGWDDARGTLPLCTDYEGCWKEL